MMPLGDMACYAYALKAKVLHYISLARFEYLTIWTPCALGRGPGSRF